MKLSLNVDFDSLQEYLEFMEIFQNHFGVKKPVPLVSNVKPRTAPPTKKQKTGKPQKPVATIIPEAVGFQPSIEMIQKVKSYIEKGQAFKTADIATAAMMRNPNRRTLVNKWLQAFDNLHVARGEKVAGQRGNSPLIYTPIRFENGKMILPNHKKPTKSNWPIKGAGYKPAYAQRLTVRRRRRILGLNVDRILKLIRFC